MPAASSVIVPGLLVLAGAIFLGARFLEPVHPWLGFVRATAEASRHRVGRRLRRLFEARGIARFDFVAQRGSLTKGDGGVYTSLKDYAKWTHALQQNKLINLPATRPE